MTRAAARPGKLSTGTSLVKFRHAFDSRRFIAHLLRQLGIAKSVCVKNFWEVNGDRLEWILFDAKQNYLAHARALHPRRADDDREAMTCLNALWQEIQRRFKARMEPTIIPKAGVPRPCRRASWKRGVYIRVCRYELCQKLFTTNHPRKVYCCRRHMTARAVWKHKRIKRARAPRYWLRCQFVRCRKKGAFVSRNPKKKYHSPRCAKYQANLNWYHRHRAVAVAELV